MHSMSSLTMNRLLLRRCRLASTVTALPRGWGSDSEQRLLSAYSHPSVLSSSQLSLSVSPSFVLSPQLSLFAASLFSRSVPRLLCADTLLLTTCASSLSSTSAAGASFSQQVVIYRPRQDNSLSLEFWECFLSCVSYLYAHIEVMKEVRKVFTWEDKEALWDYSGDGYRPMNKGLRGEMEISDELQERIDAVDRALSKLPSHEGKTFRGLPFRFEAASLKDSFRVGETFSDGAFFSTSSAKRKAESFGEDCLLTVLGKTGKKIDKYSGAEKEKEVLFRPGTVFKVTAVKKKDQRRRCDGKRIQVLHVTLEEVV